MALSAGRFNGPFSEDHVTDRYWDYKNKRERCSYGMNLPCTSTGEISMADTLAFFSKRFKQFHWDMSTLVNVLFVSVYGIGPAEGQYWESFEQVALTPTVPSRLVIYVL